MSRFAMPLLVCAALTACQAPVAPPPASGTEPSGAEAPKAPATAALPPQPVPEPVIDDEPQRLMGIGPGALQALLGEPELMRREAPAEIWQYRGATCVFDVFLYDTAGRREVTYVEARDGTAQPIEARACLNELLRARLTRPLG